LVGPLCRKTAPGEKGKAFGFSQKTLPTTQPYVRLLYRCLTGSRCHGASAGLVPRHVGSVASWALFVASQHDSLVSLIGAAKEAVIIKALVYTPVHRERETKQNAP